MSTLQEEYFGRQIGSIALYQLPMLEFNQACMSSNSTQEKDFDSTGKRMYAGAHVAIRFLAAHSELLLNRSVIELGCGTGAVGLLANEHANIRKLVLTDGNRDTLVITERNIHKFNESKLDTAIKVDDQLLIWGCDVDIANVISMNNDNPYNVVVGCELMYYQTDIDLLLSTVMKLMTKDGKTTGVFIHAHLFRRSGQEQELIDHLLAYHWTTIEIPPKTFLAKEELSYHPEWYRVRTLISAPAEVIEGLLAVYPQWRLFTAIALDEDDDDDEEEEKKDELK